MSSYGLAQSDWAGGKKNPHLRGADGEEDVVLGNVRVLLLVDKLLKQFHHLLHITLYILDGCCVLVDLAVISRG